MIEVVNHLFDNFWIISIAQVVKAAFVGLGLEIENARNCFLSICKTIDSNSKNRVAWAHLKRAIVAYFGKHL